MEALKIEYNEKNAVFETEKAGLLCHTGRLWGQIVVAPVFTPPREESNPVILMPGQTHHFEEPCYLEIRLQSTAAGNAANWDASDVGRKHLNGSPYHPVFRGWVESFCWLPPDTRPTRKAFSSVPSFETGSGWWEWDIAQGGNGAPNWATTLDDDQEPHMQAPDINTYGGAGFSFREHGYGADYQLLRQALDLACIGDAPMLKQGHLELCYVSESCNPEGFDIPGWDGHPTIYNHFVSKGGVRCQANEFYLVWLSEGCVVLSPDHEPVFVNVPGWYVGYHPAPQGGGVD